MIKMIIARKTFCFFFQLSLIEASACPIFWSNKLNKMHRSLLLKWQMSINLRLKNETYLESYFARQAP